MGKDATPSATTPTTTCADAQIDLFGKISRVCENVRKLGAGKITIGTVESRLELLEDYWEKFNSQAERLFPSRELLAEHAYIKQDVPSQTEEAYLLNKAALKDFLRSLKPETEKAVPPKAANDAPTSSRRTTLPRIQLPTFSGKYEDWPAFRDIFKSIISEEATMSKVEKMHYLKSCLKGEAELLIRDLTITEKNYDSAWGTLSDYYENKRLLVRAYLSNFIALQRMKNESAVELRKIFHGIKNTVSSLKGIARPITSSEDLFVYLCVDLLDPRSRREWETSINETTEPPCYELLEKFLDRRLHTLESLMPVKLENNATKLSPGAQKSTRSHLARKQETRSDGRRERCSICQKDHFVMLCEEYKRKSAQEKKQHITDNGLCHNCLGKHKVNECASKKNCTACGKRHHTSIHDACRESEVAVTSHVAQSTPVRNVPVLLATARLRVSDRHGVWHVARALVDQGSEASMISERLAQRLKLPRSTASVTILGVNGQKTGVSRGVIALSFSPLDGGIEMSVPALVIPRVTVLAGGLDGRNREWAHLSDLKLADPEYFANDTIDVLLAADAYALILESGLRKGGPHEPMAQKTVLGWILSGTIDSCKAALHANAYQCSIKEDLSTLVRQFWEQEEVQHSNTLLSQAERECEEFYARTHSRCPDGRYMVRLPLIEPVPDLTGTRRAAQRTLSHMEAKFLREASFRDLYVDFMRQYAELGHMTPVAAASKSSSARVCYLPHHGVLRESSCSTKLRVVFNGSSTLPSGTCLNKHMQIGPNLLPALADILLQWRRHRYVIATDIEKMYRQIDVHPEDRDLQRIIWREQPTDQLTDYQLTTVTYGMACAPYLAIRTLRQLADDETDNFPLGAVALRNDVYMDDILSGASSIEATKAIQKQLISICKAGGFPLKKWSANDEALLEDLPTEDRLQQERWWQPGESQTTLGLRWHPHEDQFAFSMKQRPLTDITKRTVLSLTAKLFDPLGWLSPVTIKAKIYIQATWLLGVDWDTPLPDNEARKWVEFQDEFPLLEDLRVPRMLAGGEKNHHTEIHGFADASERAYAAVIYLRAESPEGQVKISLVTAKTKVSPLKQVSLPRLELCAATLLVRLTAHVIRVLKISEIPLHLWTDSTVTLSWIRGHPASWTTYVANRQGPSWLHQESTSWNQSWNCLDDDKIPERRVRVHVATAPHQDEEEPEMMLKYSSWSRLLRITGWCRRWLKRRTPEQPRVTTPLLQAEELEEARVCLIRACQAAKFKTELNLIKQSQYLPSRHPLAKLNPFLDEKGLLRVGGRLKHAQLPHDMKHQVILPEKSRLTDLVIDAHHRRTLHGGVQLTLASLREEYWIPRGRTIVKACIHRCVQCLRWRAAISQPLMGNLPAPRVTPTRPFTHTGVDYAGPVWLRSAKGRGHKAHKAFFVVFICFSSRAVHLDIASDYTADAFLAALRRFVARRGLCHDLYSDCGTNFVGADAQLRSLFTASSREGQRIAAYAANERIRWHFNPPAAPNFGGIWEAAVKSAKHHLRRVIGEATLTYEEMATLLAQVEACLNSRPLQALSDDPDDLSVLTPSHFLVGSSLNTVPEPSLLSATENRLTRWQLLQKMRDHFWQRWSREYLTTLTHRAKWCRQTENVEIGRLCLLRCETTPPSKWPLARIIRLYPGEDGQVRVVEARTATSRFTRPVNKLILLPACITKEDN